LAVTLFAAGRACAQDPAWPPEALEVLARFEGQWETRTTIRHADNPRDINTRGKGSCRRTLEGRYFEFRTETVPPGESELQIMTFDAGKNVYRQWVFSSDGYRHEAVGTWNAATSTLRWRGASDGASFVIDDQFVSPDRLDWTLRRVDSAGRELQTIEGTLTRVRRWGAVKQAGLIGASSVVGDRPIRAKFRNEPLGLRRRTSIARLSTHPTFLDKPAPAPDHAARCALAASHGARINSTIAASSSVDGSGTVAAYRMFR
jgi:hypothetical protein